MSFGVTLAQGVSASPGPGGGGTTGTGVAVLQNSPTLVTPNIGAATASSIAVTGNVNVQGTLSSTANTQPAGTTNSGIALGGGPSYAIAAFYDQTASTNNRTSQAIFISGAMTFRFVNDA